MGEVDVQDPYPDTYMICAALQATALVGHAANW